MAKIPRIQQGDRPSVVPRGGLPQTGFEGKAVLQGLSGLADVGVQIAGDAERREAERLRSVLEAKQAITNEVAGARMVGDFEEDLVGFSEGLKKQYWDQPEKAIEAFIEPARARADEFQKGSVNGEVALDFARQSGTRIQAITRELHDWVSARQTQKAKGDLSVLANRVSAGAEAQSLSTLPTYLAGKEAQLMPLFDKVYGGEAQKKMSELKSDSVRAFIATREDPVAILTAANELARTDGGVFVDNLNGSDRGAARRELAGAFEGAVRARNFKQLREGVAQNADLARAFQDGSLDGGTIWAARRALETQKKALMVGLQDEDKLLNSSIKEGQLSADAGFNVKNRKEVLELIDSRLAALDGLAEARRKQLPYDATDDVDTVAAVAAQTKKILDKKTPTGKDLKDVLELQKFVAIALGDKKITQGTANTYTKSVGLAVKSAIENAENVTGPNTWWANYRDPRASGETVLNIEFKKHPNLTQAQKNDIRVSYERQFSDAAGANVKVDRDQAKNMALRALSLETKEVIPGLK